MSDPLFKAHLPVNRIKRVSRSLLVHNVAQSTIFSLEDVR